MHHGGPPIKPRESGESSMPVDHRITSERARGLYHEHGIVEPRRRRGTARYARTAHRRPPRGAQHGTVQFVR